jgi:hypothetical protein
MYNGVFGFPLKKNSSLPTLKASREIKNWNFTWIFYHELEIKLLVRLPNFKAKIIHQIFFKKKSTNIGRCGKSFAPTNFDSLPRIEFFFLALMFFFFGRNQFVLVIYGKNLKSKRSLKKDIPNLPTCVILRYACGNHFHYNQL